MKEITIRYNTYAEYKKDGDYMQVLIDGKPIENMKSFSIKVNSDDIEPVYTVEQYMDYPFDDDEYNGNNYCLNH